MATSQLPDSQFFRIDEDEIEDFKKSCCILYHVKFYNFKSKLYNNYIPSSKCVGKKGCRFDNGRIIKGEEIEMCVTDIDFDIINDSYEIEEIGYIDIYASYKKYLPKENWLSPKNPQTRWCCVSLAMLRLVLFRLRQFFSALI
jgi:hypothetical protein